MNKTMILVLIGILLAGCASNPSSPFTHIYAFGDEYTDNGNSYDFGKVVAENNEDLANYLKWLDTYYWQGRYSNGPLPVEVLAEETNVDLTNYAFAGALSDFHNIAEAISQLTNAGAKQFVVVNMHDISKQPLMLDEYIAGAGAYQSWFNAMLPDEMKKLAMELDVKISIFDDQAVEDRILSNADDYGLTNLKDKCLVWTETGESTACESPDDYFYWDDEHPTRHVNQIIGEAMAEQLSK
jgi:phospholipase/lecithinase/hemolysin